MEYVCKHFILARHVVEKQENIDNAMKVLKDCDLLKIEDILPFFPDFVTIDKFKVSAAAPVSVIIASRFTVNNIDTYAIHILLQINYYSSSWCKKYFPLVHFA